jgi:hypothetical protein
MSSIEENIKVTQEKITYLFFNSFRKKYKLLTLEIHPDYSNENKNSFDSYDIQIELDISREIDPDFEYVFENVGKTLKEMLEFCKEYTINLEGKMQPRLPYEFGIPILFGVDYLYGDKLEIKTLIRVSVS